VAKGIVNCPVGSSPYSYVEFTFTLPTTGWTTVANDTTGYPKQYSLSADVVSSDFINVIIDISSQQEAYKCGLAPSAESSNDAIIFRAVSVPENSISGHYWVSRSVEAQSNVKIGNLDNLSTTAKNNTVAAINEVLGNLGDKSSLDTTVKTNTVAAINEVNGLVDCLRGALSVSRAGDGAGLHNYIYRGASLGNSVTEDQWTAIQNGTFEDLWLGDYWTIGGNNWRIACFDYFLHCGDTAFESHHALIVPDYIMYNAQMHNTTSGSYESGAVNTTEGGYINSDMRKNNLATAKTAINNAFGSSHVLVHREYLTNAVANGRSSGGAWVDSTVELMNEEMVYGTGIFHPVSDGSTVPYNYTISKGRLPLFIARPDLVCGYILSNGTPTRNSYWLRDVLSSAYFAYVSYNGRAINN